MAEKLPTLNAPPKIAGPRASNRPVREAPIVHEHIKSQEETHFNGAERLDCRYCSTPLINPKLPAPDGSRGVLVPVSRAVALTNPSIKNGRVLVCPCCAIERHQPTLIDHLDRGDITVLAWTDLTPTEAPGAPTITDYLRLSYGYMALADMHQRGTPGYRPLLNDAETQVIAALRLYGLTFAPVWGVPRIRVVVNEFIRNTGYPVPLPDPETPLLSRSASPKTTAWSKHAWSQVVAANWTEWQALRPELLLLPSPRIAHNPFAEVENRIRSATPEDLDPAYAQMLGLAGIDVQPRGA